MAGERLINSTEELKQVLGAVNTDLVFDAIKSYVDDADIKHIIPAIGQGSYDVLRGDALNDKQTRARMLLRKAIANFTIHNYAAIGAVQIGETGIMVLKDDRQAPASDKKVYMLRMQTRADAYTSLEAAVNYLESNLADFPSYVSDAAHARNRSMYVNTTLDFQEGFDIQNQAEVFASLRAVMKRVEADYIDPLLGDTVSVALRTAILNNNATADQVKLITRIGKATTLLTIAEAIPYRLLNFAPNGLVTATLKSSTENVDNTNEADSKRLQALMNATLQKGLSQVASLTKWLNANATIFTGYQTQDLDANSKINDIDRAVYLV